MDLAGDGYSHHSPANVSGVDKAVGLAPLSPLLLLMVSLLLLTPRSLILYTPGCVMMERFYMVFLIEGGADCNVTVDD